MHGREASGVKPARCESATAMTAWGKVYMRDGAGPRLRVALQAMGEVGGPLEAVFAIWFERAGARRSLMPADQRRAEDLNVR